MSRTLLVVACVVAGRVARRWLPESSERVAEREARRVSLSFLRQLESMEPSPKLMAHVRRRITEIEAEELVA